MKCLDIWVLTLSHATSLLYLLQRLKVSIYFYIFMSFIEFWRKKSNWRTIFPRHSNLKWDIFGQILCHEIFSVIIRIEWWLWRRSIIEASLPMASCQNVRPSHLQCPTADLRVMHGFCRSTSTLQCTVFKNHPSKSHLNFSSSSTIIFVSR